MNLPFYTVGHSTRSLEALAALLATADVQLLVDIRTVRKSRTNPQYGQDVLPTGLAAYGLAYEAIEELGGLRGKSKTVAPEVNGLWHNQSFHNYADHALTENFQRGLARLIALGRERRAAVMCSEAVWWRCHRRIVADYLLARGETVFHLMGEHRLEPARLTEGAVVRKDGMVAYPVPGPGPGPEPA
ncbi:DUF488 domain-containing protein [Achromobacter aloeverae]|uniref:DNA repair protein n=1 Tax=Achromobacter aloeverae TaxID=1750518 RepID=A0A4Q1HGK9_9BURK|nr:DUF488 domain-containing protein [Achromobacter aloeverae]RXN86242.1 DNA repair protein [Achromobacter aloeverae]